MKAILIISLPLLALVLSGCVEQIQLLSDGVRTELGLGARPTGRRITPPQVVAEAKPEDLLGIVRSIAPDAYLVSVEDLYTLTTIEEIERFLQCDRTESLNLSYHDYAIILMGNFSATPGWEKVPVGILGTDDAFYNLAIVWEEDFYGGRVRVYQIDPRTDSFWPIYWAREDIRLVVF